MTQFAITSNMELKSRRIVDASVGPVHESYPGHPGRPGQRGGSLPTKFVDAGHTARALKRGETLEPTPGLRMQGGAKVADLKNPLFHAMMDRLAELEEKYGARFAPEVVISPGLDFNGSPFTGYSAVTIHPDGKGLKLPMLAVNPVLLRYEQYIDPGAQVVAGRLASTPEEYVRMVVEHEYAHALALQSPGSIGDVPMGWQQVYGSARTFPSPYAAQSAGENFAESFTAYMHGHGEKLPKTAIDILRSRWIKEAKRGGSPLVAVACDFARGRSIEFRADGSVATVGGR